jgi:hypothetical protein
VGKLILAFITLVLAYFAAYGVAKYKNTDRFVAYAAEAKQACRGRGSDALTAEQVGERTRAAAEQVGVELLELRVSVEPLTQANAARAGAVMQAAVQQAQALSHGKHFAGMPGDPPATTESFGQLAIMNATVRAKKWLWSDERDVEITCVRQ